MKKEMILLTAFAIALASLFGGVTAAQYTVSSIEYPAGGNGTYLNYTYMNLSVTLNQSATNCTFIVNQTYYLAATNASASAGDKWTLNITNQKESYSDKSSGMNVTVAVDRGGANATNITGYQWWVDTITPVVANYTTKPYTFNSTGGDNVVVSSAVTDNNTVSCGYVLYHRTLQADTVTYVDTYSGAVNQTTAVRTTTCNATFSYVNLTKNGFYTVQGFAVDQTGKKGVSTQNETVIVNILKANKWNAIAALYSDANETMSWGDEPRGGTMMSWTLNHTSISYISTWNESSGEYLTHQINTGTNNLTQISVGFPLYVYPNADSLLIRRNVTIAVAYENVSFHNRSLRGGAWTLAGNVYADYTTLAISTGTLYTSWVSYLNISNGYYYTYMRGFGPAVNNVTIPIGQCIWMDGNNTSDFIWNRRTNA